MKKMNLRKTTIASITNLELRQLKGGIPPETVYCIPTVTHSRPTEQNNASKNPRSGGGRL
jgi:hypothetical protein